MVVHTMTVVSDWQRIITRYGQEIMLLLLATDSFINRLGMQLKNIISFESSNIIKMV